ncbi:protein-export chaperone SecB [Asticcacaulis sp. EMRT-3]|uniref:protein-export chaperone SecB n=1 Tax=Asticcacaulis sp. EMRT-3 TaxID=3040349 RepID=UPI0024AFAC2D|nr:protein-export chaperone SecB [Asticcacaulis sp. EMRT-3]MDI7775831.1 protein-export chaperone SecB [Asticcacaulis sp. EMRT-3]
MTDNDTTTPAAQNPDQNADLSQQPPAAQMQVLAQFIRDFSFENPRAPNSLRVESRPDVDLGVEMSAKGRPDGLFEVDIKLNVKASTSEGAMFAIELVYGGLFQLGNMPEALVEPTLLVECPRYLFPFARRIVADATADGGFTPPFYLDPIDFGTLYMQQRAQLEAQRANGGPVAGNA